MIFWNLLIFKRETGPKVLNFLGLINGFCITCFHILVLFDFRDLFHVVCIFHFWNKSYRLASNKIRTESCWKKKDLFNNELVVLPSNFWVQNKNTNNIELTLNLDSLARYLSVYPIRNKLKANQLSLKTITVKSSIRNIPFSYPGPSSFIFNE